MRLRLTVALVSITLLMACGLGASATDVFPNITLIYDQLASTYTYRVTMDCSTSHPFGQLFIYTYATSWNGTEDTWTKSGPFVGGTDVNWGPPGPPEGMFNEGDNGDTVVWRAVGDQEVIPQASPWTWTGDFVIYAPGTSPVSGSGMLKDGAAPVHDFIIDVPGPALNSTPEPSSLAALASFAGLAGMLVRRRRM